MTEQNQNQNQVPPMPTNEELARRIFSDLMTLPDELLKFESFTGSLQQELARAKEALQAAKLEAQINAPATGKNAEERKLQADAAIAKSEDVKAAQTKVIDYETSIASQEVQTKELARRYAAALAMAEFQSARLNMLAATKAHPAIQAK